MTSPPEGGAIPGGACPEERRATSRSSKYEIVEKQLTNDFKRTSNFASEGGANTGRSLS